MILQLGYCMPHIVLGYHLTHVVLLSDDVNQFVS